MVGYLTAQQLAERWQLSDREIQRMAAGREIAAVRIGRNWRFSLDAVEAYEAAHTSAPDDLDALAVAVTYRPADGAVSRPPAIELDGTYEPVVKGVVPWRSSVIEAAPVAGRGRTARTKKAALSGN